MSRGVRLLAAGVVVAAGSVASAHEGDIGIRNVGGRLGTVLVDGEPPLQVFRTDEERVFGVELEWSVLDLLVMAEEPGYASTDASVLGRSVRADILKALRVWNGSSFIATTVTMSTGKPPAFPLVTTPATDTTVSPSPFTVTDDFHFDWILDGATDTTGFGIYLAELQLVDTSSAGALLPSAPYWIVFNHGLTEVEHEAAIEWAVDNLVPAPGSAALLAGAFGLVSRRRRR